MGRIFLEARVDNPVGLHGRDGDVEHPEEDEAWWGNRLEELGSSQLSSDGSGPPGEQDGDGKTSLDTEHSHRETQAEKYFIIRYMAK